MKHLTPDEVVDAVEGALSPERRAHVEGCAGCARQVADVSVLLNRTRAIDVPEPSPLFWPRFSDRVRVAIATEPAPPRRQRWFAWPVLAPVAALALIVIALAGAMSNEPPIPALAPPITADATEAVPANEAAELEAVWALASDLMSADAGVAERELAIAPGSAEGVAAGLSAAEQQELMRLIQQELEKSGG